MQNLTFTFEIVFTLLAAFFGGALAKKLRLPLLTGYVFAGVIGGLLFPSLKKSDGVSTLADIGVAFLLFSLGLEFSLHRLGKIKKIAVYGGLLQVIATTFWGMLLFSFFGLSLYEALFLGSVFSLSSTAVVVKVLSDRGELDTLPGEIMIGILVIQDLLVLPLAILLPTISSFSTLHPSILTALFLIITAILKAGVLLFVVLVFGKKGMPFILTHISKLNSRELLLLSVVGICLTAALITYSLGLSFALGAFLAGILIAETSSKHAVFSEIRPLKDVFSILFFVSLGLFFNVSFFLTSFSTIIGFSIAILTVKFIVLFIIILYFGYHLKTAFTAAFGIFQVGEFAFLLSRTELVSGHITDQTYSLVIATTLLTIIITPFIFSFIPRFYIILEKLIFLRLPIFKQFLSKIETYGNEVDLSSHVIICGFGRVGKHIGRALDLARIPYIVIDYNHSVVSSLRGLGQKVIYGDPTEIDVLKVSNIAKAKAIVIAINDRLSQEIITSSSLSLAPGIIILCRSHFEEDRERLLASGVNFVIQPEFEAGMSMVSHLLSVYQLPNDITSSLLHQIRRERR